MPMHVVDVTQIAAVIAAAISLDPSIVRSIAQGTTRWLINDPNSDMEKIMASVHANVPIVYVNMDYSESPYDGLQAYEWGYIKEGVGCGGSSVAAIAQSAGKITCDDLLKKVHEIYEKLMDL